MSGKKLLDKIGLDLSPQRKMSFNRRVSVMETSLEKSLEDVNREIGDFLVPRIDMR